jgi:hypothetical protein
MRIDVAARGKAFSANGKGRQPTCLVPLAHIPVV